VLRSCHARRLRCLSRQSCRETFAATADVAQFWPGALVATRVLDHLTVARLAKEAQQARVGPHRLLVSLTDAGSIGGRVRPFGSHMPDPEPCLEPHHRIQLNPHPSLGPDPTPAGLMTAEQILDRCLQWREKGAMLTRLAVPAHVCPTLLALVLDDTRTLTLT